MQTYTLLEKLLYLPTPCNEKKLNAHLAGKTMLITGASSGIGEQLAYLLASIPIHLILVARSEEKLLTMKGEMEAKGAKVTVYAIDLRDQDKVDELLSFLHDLPDGLDIVVSNAGHSIKRSLLHSLDRFHDATRTMAINYFAPVQLLLSLIPLLEQKQGHIINVSSINPLLYPLPHWAAYQASKSAFDSWFRSAAPELNVMGISTSTIYFPLVRTPMILPTSAYHHAPAMSSIHAAKVICNRLYTKRKVYKPWWLLGLQIGSIVFRGPIEKAMPKWLEKWENKR